MSISVKRIPMYSKVLASKNKPSLSRLWTLLRTTQPFSRRYLILNQSGSSSLAKVDPFIKTLDFSFVFDGMNGVSGPYAKAILGDLLGSDPKNL